jgi:hypothetical protein
MEQQTLVVVVAVLARTQLRVTNPWLETVVLV